MDRQGTRNTKKVLKKGHRSAYGPVKEDDQWRIRNNQEIDELLNHEGFVRFIKVQ